MGGKKCPVSESTFQSKFSNCNFESRLVALTKTPSYCSQLFHEAVMPVVEVLCSGCGAKLKAPQSMAGRKAKCKRCGNSFRVPGALPSDSVGDGQPLSAFSTPSPFSSEDVLMAEPVDEIPMASAVVLPPPPAPPIPPPAPIPAKDLSSLPSADPFDFGKPAKPAKPTPATPAAKPVTATPIASTTPPVPTTPKAPPAPSAPAATKPVTATPIASTTPPVPTTPKAPPAPPAPAAAKPATPSTPAAAPTAKPATTPAAAPTAKAVAPLNNPTPPATKAKVESAEPSNPFAFTDSPAKTEKVDKPKRRRDEDEEDEDELKTKKKKRTEEDEEPVSKKDRKRSEEEDADEPKAKKKRSEEDNDEEPLKKKKRAEEEDELKAKKTRRDDDEEDEPKAKRKRPEEEDQDVEDEQPTKTKAKSAIKEENASHNPFSDFGASEEKSEKKSKRRDEEEDEPKAKKKRRDDDAEDEPKPKKKRTEEEQKKDEDAVDEQPTKTKAKSAPKEASEPQNPFSDFGASEEKSEKKSKRRDEEEDEPKAKKKRRDDDVEDEPKPKKKRDEEKDQDVEDEQPTRTKTKPAPKEASEPFNPFANFGTPQEPEKKPKRRDEEEDEPKAKKKRRDDDVEDEPKSKKKSQRDEHEGEEEQKPRYQRPEQKGGMGMTILITAVVGLFALGLGITALVMFVKNNRKEQMAKKEEKKDEASIPSGPNESDPKPKDKDPDPKSRDFNPKPKDKGPDPKPKDKDPDPKLNPNPGPGPIRPGFVLPAKLKTINVEGAPPKAQPADKPQAGMVLDTPFKSVKRFFPPMDPKTADTYVLIQTSAGVGGTGEKLALDTYSPSNGARVAAARIEYDGDSLPNPIADLSVSVAGTYFLAATSSRLHVWAVNTKSKIADGVNPYAEKPEHAKSGLAAAFFAADPNQVVLVSTAGAVLLYDLRTNKPVSEFIPPNGVTGKVSLGKSVAKADGGGSVGIAVAGVLYQVKSAPGLEVVRQFDLGGDVRNSLGLDLSGTPGRILYTFDTIEEKPGQSTTVIVGVPLGENAKPIIYRSPAIGAISGALWAGEMFGGVVAGSGVLWFDDDEGKFRPLVMTRPTNGASYAGGTGHFWYVIPHPKEMTKNVLVGLSLPFADFPEYLKRYEGGQPLRSVVIDSNGLAK